MVEHKARTSDCQPSYDRDDDYLDSLPYDIASVDLTWSSSVLVKQVQQTELTRIASAMRVSNSYNAFLNVFLLTSWKNWSTSCEEMKPCHT